MPAATDSDKRDVIYTPAQFSALIGRSNSTLKNWDRSGLLTAGRYPSGHRFYTCEHLDQVLARSTED